MSKNIISFNLSVKSEGHDHDVVADIANLNRWIAGEDWIQSPEIIFKMNPVTGEDSDPSNMGDLNTILQVALNSAAVICLIKSIHVWLKNRGADLTIELTNETIKGKNSLRINSKNIRGREKALIEEIIDTFRE